MKDSANSVNTALGVENTKKVLAFKEFKAKREEEFENSFINVVCHYRTIEVKYK